jgi:adenylate cyclase
LGQLVSNVGLRRSLAADVAGYSRLIETDEEGTLDRLKALRAEVIDPKIATHRGRIVKTSGDGLLVEFASVLDALRCAYVQICQYGNGAAVSIASRRRRFMRGDLPCFDDRCWRRETLTGLAVTLSHLERM